jgi:DNA-binding LacI/PurR family transcriptional regulator
VRELVNEVIGAGSIVFFDDTSVVWVCVKPTTTVDANACEIARVAAKQFLNIRNPMGRWEGKIDAAVNSTIATCGDPICHTFRLLFPAYAC